MADIFMLRKRGSLDPAYLEMSLFLRAQYRLIPNDVPTLTPEEAAAAIPNRFRDQSQLDEVKEITVTVEEEDDDGGEDDADDAWVVPPHA